MKLGPTGKFPRGMLGPSDDGELRMHYGERPLRPAPLIQKGLDKLAGRAKCLGV